MRSTSLLLAVVGLASLTSNRAVAKDGQIVSVLELRSHVREDVDPGRLTDRVREVARGALPDSKVLPSQEVFVLADTCNEDCDIAAARDQGADLVASGSVTSGNPGYRVSLVLRQVRSGQVVARSSALSLTIAELLEAVAAAAVDLFHSSARTASPTTVAQAVAVDSPALPALPALPAVPEGGAVNLSVDANVLVAYDRARNIELRGKEKPDEAAYAWEAVANADGENPYRGLAAERARSWRAYADNKHAFESQLARDTARLRKVLPLGSVTDAVKLELLTRYSKAYGATRANAMLPYVPAGALRDRAVLVMGCEGNEPAKCLTLARFAQDSRDDKSATEYMERACAAGAFGVCGQAADRLQSTDNSRATTALQKGCSGLDGKSCARLAKGFEDGSAGKVDAAVAADYREKACSAGDGKSCRKLAAALDSGDDAADQRRAAELWRKGCAGGDPTSCSFARMNPPPARAAVQEATFGTRPASTAPTAPPPPPQNAPAPTTPANKPLQTQPTSSNDTPSPVGSLLIGAGILAGGGALFLAANDSQYSGSSGSRTHLTQSSGSSHFNYAPLLGAAALLSTFTGIGLVLQAQSEKKPDPVQVGLAPTGLVVTGKLP
jgi:TPR repeat protein